MYQQLLHDLLNLALFLLTSWTSTSMSSSSSKSTLSGRMRIVLKLIGCYLCSAGLKTEATTATIARTEIEILLIAAAAAAAAVAMMTAVMMMTTAMNRTGARTDNAILLIVVDAAAAVAAAVGKGFVVEFLTPLLTKMFLMKESWYDKASQLRNSLTIITRYL